MSINIEKAGIINTSNAIINPNLLINTTFSSTYSETRWDTSKNGTIEAYDWGGYNSGVLNPSTVYHAHLKNFNGELVYEYIRTSAESWLGIAQGISVGLQPNTTYTWSIDEYRTSGSNNYITAGVYYKRNSSESNSFYSGCPHGTGEDAYDKWVRRYYTFTIDSIYNNTGSFYIYGHYGGNGTIYMRRPKLEVGSIATPWIGAESEGYIYKSNGLVESQTGFTRIYKDYIETNEFIEI